MSSHDTTLNSEGEMDEHDTSTSSQEIRGISRKEFSHRIKYLIQKVDSLNEKMDGILATIRSRQERSRSPSPTPIYSNRNFLDV